MRQIGGIVLLLGLMGMLAPIFAQEMGSPDCKACQAWMAIQKSAMETGCAFDSAKLKDGSVFLIFAKDEKGVKAVGKAIADFNAFISKTGPCDECLKKLKQEAGCEDCEAGSMNDMCPECQKKLAEKMAQAKPCPECEKKMAEMKLCKECEEMRKMAMTPGARFQMMATTWGGVSIMTSPNKEHVAKLHQMVDMMQAMQKGGGEMMDAESAPTKTTAGPLAKGDGISTCLVTGDEVDKNVSATINGKTYFFCCKGCVNKVKANPERYVRR